MTTLDCRAPHEPLMKNSIFKSTERKKIWTNAGYNKQKQKAGSQSHNKTHH